MGRWRNYVLLFPLHHGHHWIWEEKAFDNWGGVVKWQKSIINRWKLWKRRNKSIMWTIENKYFTDRIGSKWWMWDLLMPQCEQAQTRNNLMNRQPYRSWRFIVISCRFEYQPNWRRWWKIVNRSVGNECIIDFHWYELYDWKVFLNWLWFIFT